jgi:hypothetical protein
MRRRCANAFDICRTFPRIERLTSIRPQIAKLAETYVEEGREGDEFIYLQSDICNVLVLKGMILKHLLTLKNYTG